MSRSRRCRSRSSTASSPLRTRISTTTAGWTSPASHAPVSTIVQNFGSSRRPQGASTITQQVAKNFLLTNEVSFTRKIKEALLALKIERTYSKDKILELYLNEIYLGLGAYGIAAASLVYFDKAVNELTIRGSRLSRRVAQGAEQLSSVPSPRTRARAPQLGDRPHGGSRLHQVRRRRAGQADRSWRYRRSRPLSSTFSLPNILPKKCARELYERYGEKKLYEGGLSVRTTLDTKMQVIARKTLIDGLVKSDEAHGWRGAVSKIDISGDWGVKLAEVKALNDVAPWRLAAVLEVNDQSARIGLQPARDQAGYLGKRS